MTRAKEDIKALLLEFERLRDQEGLSWRGISAKYGKSEKWAYRTYERNKALLTEAEVTDGKQAILSTPPTSKVPPQPKPQTAPAPIKTPAPTTVEIPADALWVRGDTVRSIYLQIYPFKASPRGTIQETIDEIIHFFQNAQISPKGRGGWISKVLSEAEVA